MRQATRMYSRRLSKSTGSYQRSPVILCDSKRLRTNRLLIRQASVMVREALIQLLVQVPHLLLILELRKEMPRNSMIRRNTSASAIM